MRAGEEGLKKIVLEKQISTDFCWKTEIVRMSSTPGFLLEDRNSPHVLYTRISVGRPK